MEVAYQLRLPLFELTAKMPYEELLMWIEFFKERPVGWREDERTYRIMQAFGVKEKPDKIFASLALMAQNARNREAGTEENKEGLNIKSLKNSAFFQRMQSAVGGVKIPE
jgi:hypothetical protein